jgi:Flp pilus assembly protein TadG
MRGPVHPRSRQRGASALEFALVAMLGFLPLLFGIVQMGLVFFSVNFAAEATRHVARTAVVCGTSPEQQAKIKAHITALLPAVFQDGTAIDIDYNQPAACTNPGQPCVTVTVAPGIQVPNVIPFWGFSWPLPTLRTTLTPESLASSIDGSANPVCN